MKHAQMQDDERYTKVYDFLNSHTLLKKRPDKCIEKMYKDEPCIDKLVDRLKSKPILLQETIDAYTNTDTRFFRDPEQMNQLSKIMKDSKGNGKRVHVFSFGCSSGEEAYSAAMVMGSLGVKGWVFGYDINSKALEKAKRAVYSKERLSEQVPDAYHRYITSQGGISDQVKRRVELHHYNLAGLLKTPQIKPRRIYKAKDHNTTPILFLNNVLFYIDKDYKCELLGKMVNMMPEGTYFFINHSSHINCMMPKTVEQVRCAYKKIA